MAFLSMSCSLNRLSTTGSQSSELLKNETLLRYNSDEIQQIAENDNPLTSALAECHRGNAKNALNKLKNELEENRENFEYWNKVGTCYYLSKNDSKATFFFEHALNISKKTKKKNPYSYNNLGILYLKKRHFAKAKTAFELALKTSPNLLTPKYNLSQLYLQFGQIAPAKKILLDLYGEDSKDIDLISSLGVLAIIEKEYDLAIKYFNMIPEDDQKRADIAAHFSLSLYLKGNYYEAREALKKQKVTTLKPFYKLNRKLSSLITEAIKKEEQKNK